MSFRVLVVPEDPIQNGYLLKPLARALLAHAGKPAAKEELLTSPRLRGYDQALRAIRHELPDRYGFFDLWLFFPDADRAHAEAMRRLETDLEARGISLFCCPAQPEVEIYACAAYRADLGGTWEDARKHQHMKEEIFKPLLAAHGDPRRPGRGRGPDDRSVAAEPPAPVSALPGVAVLARPHRNASSRSVNPCRTTRYPSGRSKIPSSARPGRSRTSTGCTTPAPACRRRVRGGGRPATGSRPNARAAPSDRCWRRRSGTTCRW